MKFKFQDGDEFHVRKIPYLNMIEIKIGKDKKRYERSEEQLEKITAETEEKRKYIIEKINQYFMPQERHNRHRANYLNSAFLRRVNTTV